MYLYKYNFLMSDEFQLLKNIVVILEIYDYLKHSLYFRSYFKNMNLIFDMFLCFSYNIKSKYTSLDK